MNTNQFELILHPITETSSAWLQLGLKLLDWPFLLTGVCILFIFLFREQLKALLNREDITIKWGDRVIRLRDLGDKIDQEIDPLRDELESSRNTKQVSQEKNELGGVQFMNEVEPPIDSLERMKEALRSPKFRWRTISRLAAIGCVPEETAKSLLRSDPEIVFSIGKSGNPIAKLKSR